MVSDLAEDLRVCCVTRARPRAREAVVVTH
jgi:hypothetical protein